jgi:hypothetical protein
MKVYMARVRTGGGAEMFTHSMDEPEALAVADLAAQTGVDPADIDVVASDRVTWRNGSLGCPKLGYSYVQMLVEGYRIVLHAGAENYVYHGANGEVPFRCSQPDPNGTVEGSAAQVRPYNPM